MMTERWPSGALLGSARRASGRLMGMALAALLAGCLAAPTDRVALEQARAGLEQARAAPRVRALAPAELERAEVALAHAEAAARAGAPAASVDHLAYLASRQAALAEANALDRVAQAEIARLQRALGPTPASAPKDEVEPGRAATAPPPVPPRDALKAELVLNLAELAFDAAGPSYATAKELERTAAWLIREPALIVAIRADFDQPEPAAHPTMEGRVEIVRAELLRRGVEASRIRLRAGAPERERVLSPSDRLEP
jgi:hypothetical protein